MILRIFWEIFYLTRGNTKLRIKKVIKLLLKIKRAR
jgi:hypothetical protein